MKIRTKNFAFQIWLSFISLALILVLWLFLYLKTEQKAKHLSEFSLELTNLQNSFSENFINYQNFILGGYKDEKFYTQNHQKDIDNYTSQIRKNYKNLINLKKHSTEFQLHSAQTFNQLILDYKQLITLSDSARKAIHYRGFKDYGLEGKMRSAAHKIENLSTIPRASILQLRRHEKDFLLRGERTYQNLFNSLIDTLLTNKKLDTETRTLLNNYATTFNEYISKSKELGYYNETGLINDIKKLHDHINLLMSVIKKSTSERAIALSKTNANYLIVQTIFIGIIAVLVCIFLVKTLTHDIKLLNDNFRFYINRDFLNNPDKELPKPDFKLSSIEIRKLFANFQLLKETLNKTIHKLNQEKNKSEENAHYKARFLANMSHEIRTPLNGIMGMLQMIEIEPLSSEQKHNIYLAKYSANHLLELVNMILDYSKLEEGKMNIENQTFDLALVIKNLQGIFKHQVREKNISLNVNYDANLPTYVKGDVLRIQQVLLNIMSNAVKFTKKGGVSLQVHAAKYFDNKVLVGFKITDTGIGIAPNEQKKLFEAFVQSDISTTRKFGGTGLGLTISNQLVNLMGGTIQLKSEVNKGTEFYFELLFEKAAQSNINLKPKAVAASQLKGNKVLLAEDNKINRLVLERMLTKMQMECVVAEDGVEAYELFLKNDFNIVLMDIHMPKMNGLESTQLIKATSKYINNPIPIIAITASAFEEDRKLALNEGMDDFVTKPVIFEKLKLVMQKFLSEKHLI